MEYYHDPDPSPTNSVINSQPSDRTVMERSGVQAADASLSHLYIMFHTWPISMTIISVMHYHHVY